MIWSLNNLERIAFERSGGSMEYLVFYIACAILGFSLSRIIRAIVTYHIEKKRFDKEMDEMAEYYKDKE